MGVGAESRRLLGGGRPQELEEQVERALRQEHGHRDSGARRPTADHGGGERHEERRDGGDEQRVRGGPAGERVGDGREERCDRGHGGGAEEAQLPGRHRASLATLREPGGFLGGGQ